MKKQLKSVAKAIAQAPAKLASMPAQLIKKPEIPNLPEPILKELKLKLTREVTRLEHEISKIKLYPEYGTAEDENVQELEEFNQNIGLSKNLKALLAETKDALTKLDKGTFGSCESCKKAIDSGRLQAFPAAALCISCERDATKKRWWQVWKKR
ncbi:TraR/DksA C4-type zinc finger protein [Candidatus Berkelbacteria bacterium]|nr:TraR/DksA C4-type zinc finger protein [Candidatus Berkelbacteria bacterium]